MAAALRTVVVAQLNLIVTRLYISSQIRLLAFHIKIINTVQRDVYYEPINKFVTKLCIKWTHCVG